MKARKLGLFFLVIGLMIFPFMLFGGYISYVWLPQWCKISYWQERKDYDGDGRQDLLQALFKESDYIQEKGASCISIEFADGSSVTMDELYGGYGTQIDVQVADLTGDGKCEIIVCVEYWGAGSQIAVFKKNGYDNYEQMQMPFFTEDVLQKQYMIGCDIAVLEKKGDIATIGNRKHGIIATLQLTDISEDRNTMADLSVGAARVVKVVEDEQGRNVLELYMELLDEHIEQGNYLVVTIQYGDNSWSVVNSKIEKMN